MRPRPGARRAARAAALLGALAVGGCVETVYEDPPLRQPTTPEERLYLSCVGYDPLFLTSRCREARARLSDDPFPGGAGR